jgi:hypothetical protein
VVAGKMPGIECSLTRRWMMSFTWPSCRKGKMVKEIWMRLTDLWEGTSPQLAISGGELGIEAIATQLVVTLYLLVVRAT